MDKTKACGIINEGKRCENPIDIDTPACDSCCGLLDQSLKALGIDASDWMRKEEAGAIARLSVDARRGTGRLDLLGHSWPQMRHSEIWEVIKQIRVDISTVLMMVNSQSTLSEGE